MSNGSGQSKAPYIIICSGRIDVRAAGGSAKQQRLKAASDAARNLVSYYRDKVTGEQTQPISALQHEIMDNIDTWNNHEVDNAVTLMFELLDELEDEIH